MLDFQMQQILIIKKSDLMQIEPVTTPLLPL